MNEPKELTAALLKQALSRKNKFTDLHLCQGAKPYIRTSGNLQPLDNNVFPAEQLEAVIAELLDERQLKELKKQHTLSFTFAINNLGRFRAAVYSQRGTFALNIRSLPHDIPTLETLGLPHELENVMYRVRGLVLVAGAAPATAAVLACLTDLANQKRTCRITTVEDPIEYLHRHNNSIVTQKEIGGDTTDFQTGLLWSVREDPDIIMLSELPKEPKIIMQTLKAAEERLVLAGLNAVGTTKSIEYLIDAFSSPEQIEAVTETQARVRARLAAVLDCIIYRPSLRTAGLATVADLAPVSPLNDVLILTDDTKRLIAEGRFHSLSSKLERRKP